MDDRQRPPEQPFATVTLQIGLILDPPEEAFARLACFAQSIERVLIRYAES